MSVAAARVGHRVRTVNGVTVVGVRGHLVAVEAHVGRGLPSLTLTGLPGAGVQDARDRIRPAVESAGLEWPLRRVVVNLARGRSARKDPASTCRSRWGCSQPPRRCPPRAGRMGVRGRVVAPGRAGLDPRRAVRGDRRGARGTARRGRPGVERGRGRAGGRSRDRRSGVAREVVGFLRGPGGRPRPRRRASARTCGLRSISPRSEVRPRPAGRSRWRPPADTTSSWSDHPVRARRCSRAGSPRSCRRCRVTSRSR